MDNLSGYARRPFPFVLRYIRRRRAAHLVILSAVVGAVACSVGTQYGVKSLVDSLSGGPSRADGVWLAFAFLMSLIAADNLLWRVASWIASFTFVGVTGDLRRDMFRHLTGHAPSYFSDRLPGMDAGFALTMSPGRRTSVQPTMTRSPGSKPSLTTVRPSCSWPHLTLRRTTLF